MSEPFDPRLDEVILAEPRAVEPWLVLADYLEERGHPRAELIRIGIALEPRHDAELQRSERAHLVAHHAALADFPPSVFVRWSRGFVATVVCVGTDPGIWPGLAAHRSLRFVRTMHVADPAFRFDDAPMPAGLEALELDAAALDSVDWARLPRLTRLVVWLAERPLSGERIAGILAGAPTLARLRFEHCTDRFVHELLEQLPAFVRGGLRSLAVDRFTAAHAEMLLRHAGELAALELCARPVAPFAPETYAALVALPGWRGDFGDGHTKPTEVPQRAPRHFLSLPESLELGGAWVSSGIDVSEHPALAESAERACRGCASTRTHVIWVQNEGYPLGINDCIELAYELVCLACGEFSLRNLFVSLD